MKTLIQKFDTAILTHIKRQKKKQKTIGTKLICYLKNNAVGVY